MGVRPFVVSRGFVLSVAVKIGEDIRQNLAKLPVKYEFQQHVYPKSVCQQSHQRLVMPEAQDDSLKADIKVVADVVV